MTLKKRDEKIEYLIEVSIMVPDRGENPLKFYHRFYENVDERMIDLGVGRVAATLQKVLETENKNHGSRSNT